MDKNRESKSKKPKVRVPVPPPTKKHPDLKKEEQKRRGRKKVDWKEDQDTPD
jgi:hypothetical protein